MSISINYQENTFRFSALYYLHNNDRNTLGSVNKLWRTIKREFDIECYNKLKEIKQAYLTDDTGVNLEKIVNILGSGGNKRAFALVNDRALLLPNMDQDAVQGIVEHWPRIVYEEVTLSKFLNKIDLLTLPYKRVIISTTDNGMKESIPAYSSPTFEGFTKKTGLLLINVKNPKSSTWKKGKDFLFSTDESRFHEKNWDIILDPLLTDIAKICYYHIPLGADSLNIALTKKTDPNEVSQYEVRFFGFDFSKKKDPLAIGKLGMQVSSVPNIEHAVFYLDKLLDDLFLYEFGDRYSFGPEYKKLRQMLETLVQKYSIEVVSRIQLLSEREKA